MKVDERYSGARAWLYLAALGPVATEILLMVLLARQQHIDSSGTTSSLLYTASLLGAAGMGLVGGVTMRRLTNRAIGISTGIACSVLALAAIAIDDGPSNLIFAGAIALLTALDNPNLNSTLGRILLPNQRAAGFAGFHAGLNAGVMIAPAAGAFLIHLVGPDKTLEIAAALYLFSAVPWLRLPRFDPRAGESALGCLLESYRYIATNAGLRDLTLSRLLNNLLYAAVPVAIPLLAAAQSRSHPDYIWLQGAALSAYRSGSFIASISGMVLLHRAPRMAGVVARSTTAVGAAALAGMAYAAPAAYLIGACVIAGFGQFGFRLSGLALGPSVTPPDMLSEVILAGDTLVRLYSALYSWLLVLGATSLGGVGPLLLGACLVAMPAPLFLARANAAYKEQLIAPRGAST